jgi:YD repeat-containing protein
VNRLRKLFDHDALVKYDLYDDNDRPIKVTYPHGMILNREWDGAGRVKRIRATAPTSESPAGTLVDLSYKYLSSLVHRFTDTDGTIAVYSYDPLNQLMSETKRTADGRDAGQRIWTYDANNNRDSQTL